MKKILLIILSGFLWASVLKAAVTPSIVVNENGEWLYPDQYVDTTLNCSDSGLIIQAYDYYEFCGGGEFLMHLDKEPCNVNNLHSSYQPYYFTIKRNGVPVDSIFTNIYSDDISEEYSLDIVYSGSASLDSNSCEDPYQIYTEYEITICEFTKCNNSNPLAREGGPSERSAPLEPYYPDFCQVSRKAGFEVVVSGYVMDDTVNMGKTTFINAVDGLQLKFSYDDTTYFSGILYDSVVLLDEDTAILRESLKIAGIMADWLNGIFLSNGIDYTATVDTFVMPYFGDTVASLTVMANFTGLDEKLDSFIYVGNRSYMNQWEEDYLWPFPVNQNLYELYKGTDYASGICCCYQHPEIGPYGFPAGTQAAFKKIIVRAYKDMTWIDVDKKDPCRNPAYFELVNKLADPQPVYQEYDPYGHVEVNMCRRNGGYDKGVYIIELCKDDEFNEGFNGDCATCWIREFSMDDLDPENPVTGFYNLPQGDYRLQIYNPDTRFRDCSDYTEYFSLYLANATTLTVDKNPAFICAGENNVTISVTAPEAFQSFRWTYKCDPSAPVATTSSITPARGQGGSYFLTAIDQAGCRQKQQVKVIDLNISELSYYSLDGVLQNSATKYEHCATPVLSSLSWNSPADITRFDQLNPYVSGKAGIWRGKQTFDYLEARNQQAFAQDNINIKESGFYDDVAMFNWQHPSFLQCEPKWKLNNTIEHFNISSQPIQNKDIMGLRSAKLFGFRGMLQIAEAPLGRYNEIAFESFEEYETGATVNQLNNASGNFDLVNQILPGAVLYYEEYPVTVGMSNYAIVGMNFPNQAGCPDREIVADVVSRTITNGPIGCHDSKIKEGMVSDAVLKLYQHPCEGIEGIEGTLIEFPADRVPAFGNPEDDCAQWNGFIRLKKHHMYAGKTYSNVIYTADKAHTGKMSMKIIPGSGVVTFENKDVHLQPETEYILSYWVHVAGNDDKSPAELNLYNRSNNINVYITSESLNMGSNTYFPKGPVIEGWQKVDAVFRTNAESGALVLNFNPSVEMYIDDIRLSPVNSGMQTYVYSPETYRMTATLDQNNYATIYKYDDEGNLFLVQKETVEGIKTIQMNQSYINVRP